MAIFEAGTAAIGAIKAAADIVRDVRQSRDVTILKAAINDLTAHLSDALSAVLDLQIQNAATNAALAECQAVNGKKSGFAEQAQRYIRQTTAFGGAVYVERERGDGQGDSPKFCAHCFENERISILQPLGIARQWKCPGCGSQHKM